MKYYEEFVNENEDESIVNSPSPYSHGTTSCHDMVCQLCE